MARWGRLRHSSFRGFPGCASIVACHAPFPPPAHQTGRAVLPHPAFGQGFMGSPTERCVFSHAVGPSPTAPDIGRGIVTSPPPDGTCAWHATTDGADGRCIDRPRSNEPFESELFSIRLNLPMPAARSNRQIELHPTCQPRKNAPTRQEPLCRPPEYVAAELSSRITPDSPTMPERSRRDTRTAGPHPFVRHNS